MKYVIVALISLLLTTPDIYCQQAFENNEILKNLKMASHCDSFFYANSKNYNESVLKIECDSMPISYKNKKLKITGSQLIYVGPYKFLAKYVIKELSGKLMTLPDGTYALNVSDIVVDRSGKILYYKYRGLKPIFIPSADTTYANGKKIIEIPRAQFDPNHSGLRYLDNEVIPADINDGIVKKLRVALLEKKLFKQQKNFILIHSETLAYPFKVYKHEIFSLNNNVQN